VSLQHGGLLLDRTKAYSIIDTAAEENGINATNNPVSETGESPSIWTRVLNIPVLNMKVADVVQKNAANLFIFLSFLLISYEKLTAYIIARFIDLSIMRPSHLRHFSGHLSMDTL